MAESYSVKAVLSAYDKGFTSAMKQARKETSALGGVIKNGFSFGIFATAGSKAFSAVTNGAKELVGEINSSNISWKTFDGNMKILGKSDKYINSTKKELQKFAEQTIYNSSDMAQTFAQLESVGTKNTAKLVKGFGGLASAAENPKQAMKTLSQQATQMAARPKVAWQDFKLMLEQSPSGMAAVARQMGMSSAELVSKIQAGEVATKDFFKAVEEVGNSPGFANMATKAKSAGQAADGLKETLANKLTPAFEMLSSKSVSAIGLITDSLAKVDGDKVASKVKSGMETVGKYYAVLKKSFKGVGQSVGEAIGALKTSFGELFASFGTGKKPIDTFKDAMDKTASVIKKVSDFVKRNSDTIAKATPYVLKLAVAYKGFKVVRSIVPAVSMFGGALKSLAGKGIAGIAGKLFGISKGQKEVGKSSSVSGKQMLTAAKSYALMGVAVLTIAAGFGILAYSAIKLANSGGLAIGVMAGLSVAVIGLSVGMGVMLKALAPMGKKLMPVATAFLAMGAAVLLVSAGFAVMAASAIALSNAGGVAIGVFAGMVVSMALLAVGAAALGTALTAGAVGFVAFGAAVLLAGAGLMLVGVGAKLAASALTVVTAVLPSLVQYGSSGALAMAELGVALTVFAVGAAAAGVACAVLGVGLLAVGVAVGVVAVGAIALGAALVIAGVGLNLMGVGLALVSSTAAASASGLTLFSSSLALVMSTGAAASAVILALSGGMVAMTASSVAATVAVIAFGVGMLAAVGGSAALAVALKAVNSSMKSIKNNAKTTENSLSSMNKSVKVVGSGLDALGNKAKTAMNKITSAFDSTANKSNTAGKKVGDGFTSGMKSGLSKAPTAANSTTSAVYSVLSSGYSRTYSAGAYISQGFANGMLSRLATIRSAAAQMAAAADAAVRAKAKIHSPSKVAEKLGNYWGEGYAGGLADMARAAWHEAEKLVSIPNVATPQLAYAYSGEMSGEYDYYRNSEYVIEVPLTVDGREFARATAKYSQDEIDRQTARSRRKQGKA